MGGQAVVSEGSVARAQGPGRLLLSGPRTGTALEAEAGARTLSGKAWGEGALTRNPNLNVLELLLP